MPLRKASTPRTQKPIIFTICILRSETGQRFLAGFTGLLSIDKILDEVCKW